ncbi:hypothetical protein Hanom_Chr05g00438721 [Helianthus anomalus]
MYKNTGILANPIPFSTTHAHETAALGTALWTRQALFSMSHTSLSRSSAPIHYLLRLHVSRLSGSWNLLSGMLEWSWVVKHGIVRQV